MGYCWRSKELKVSCYHLQNSAQPANPTKMQVLFFFLKLKGVVYRECSAGVEGPMAHSILVEVKIHNLQLRRRLLELDCRVVWP